MSFQLKKCLIWISRLRAKHAKKKSIFFPPSFYYLYFYSLLSQIIIEANIYSKE